MTHYRVVAYQSKKTEGPKAEARRSHTILTGLAKLDAGFEGWTTLQTDEHAPRSLATVDDCAAALERGAVSWKTGEEVRKSYVIGAQSRAGKAQIEITLGVDPHEAVPVFLPNRVDLSIEVDVGFRWPPPALVESVLEQVAAGLGADFGHAGSTSVPAIEEPLFGDGTPPVGWMTYLSSAAPRLPASLPAPAAARPSSTGGVVLIAHPKPFSEDHREQRDAITRLEEALRAAGVLVPSGQWAR